MPGKPCAGAWPHHSVDIWTYSAQQVCVETDGHPVEQMIYVVSVLPRAGSLILRKFGMD